MSNLTTFNFNSNDLRVVQLDGEPWFIAADVCQVLALRGFPSQHTAKLAGDEKLLVSRMSHVLNTRDAEKLFNTKAPSVSVISESGLYKLVLRSDKPQAKPFQDWVTKTVLPAIRKDGGYIVGEEHIDDDDLLFAKALQVAQRKIERAQLENQQFRLRMFSSTVNLF